MTDGKEEFPIHTALNSNSAGAVKEIIKMYPKQLHTKVRSRALASSL